MLALVSLGAARPTCSAAFDMLQSRCGEGYTVFQDPAIDRIADRTRRVCVTIVWGTTAHLRVPPWFWQGFTAHPRVQYELPALYALRAACIDTRSHGLCSLKASLGHGTSVSISLFSFLSIVKLLVGDRVNPALIPWMATQDPHETHPASSEDTPAINRLVGVL